ncbi:MAG: hypothetical protein ACYC63_00520 [Armatimonadota bacterium]
MRCPRRDNWYLLVAIRGRHQKRPPQRLQQFVQLGRQVHIPSENRIGNDD